MGLQSHLFEPTFYELVLSKLEERQDVAAHELLEAAGDLSATLLDDSFRHAETTLLHYVCEVFATKDINADGAATAQLERLLSTPHCCVHRFFRKVFVL